MDNQVIAKWKLKKKKKIGTRVHGTQVPWKYSSGTWVPDFFLIFFYKSHFAITWLSKNRVLHLKLDF